MGGAFSKVKEGMIHCVCPADLMCKFSVIDISIVEGFPVPVCRFARALCSRSFGEVAAYGHTEAARQIYYGLPAHVRLAWPGVLVDCALAPANIHDDMTD